MTDENLIHTFSIEGFLNFVSERESIRIKKEKGQPFPWTEDEILKTKRFCNIDRFHDKGTQEIIQALENKSLEFKFFGTLVYRIFFSGFYIKENLKNAKNIEEFVELMFSNDKIKYGKGRPPYQFRTEQGLTVKKFFFEYLYPNYLNAYQEFIQRSSSNIKENIDIIHRNLGYRKKLNFCYLQSVLDLSYYFSFINTNENIDFGYLSQKALEEISKFENLEKEDVLVKLFSKGLSLDKIEHGLCEYYKYFRYKDANRFKMKTNNYIL